MIKNAESSDLDRPAHRLGTFRLIGSRFIQPQSCSSAKNAKRSARSRHEIWKEGKCVDVSPRDPWT